MRSKLHNHKLRPRGYRHEQDPSCTDTDGRPVSSAYIARDEAIVAIRKALKARTKTRYSVRGGRGTSWGWLYVDLMPAAFNQDEDAIKAARKELHELFGLTPHTHSGISIPASAAHYREYVERAEGRTPTKIAEAYWD